MAGPETQNLVHQPMLDLLCQPDYRVVVLEDVTTGRVEAYRRAAIERFLHCGAVISRRESAASEWIRTKDSPRFRELSATAKE